MGNGNKVEMLLAVCAVITSVIAVYVAWDQGRVMRAQQHGAVYPVLQVDGFVSTTSTTASMGMRVGNSGVGPALIHDVTLSADGIVLETLDAYRDRLPEGYDLSWAGLAGRALAPGEEIIPIQITWSHEDITHDTLYATAAEWGELEMSVCYCSVFDRCWRTHAIGSSRKEQVPSCTDRGEDTFESLGRYAPALRPMENIQVE